MALNIANPAAYEPLNNPFSVLGNAVWWYQESLTLPQQRKLNAVLDALWLSKNESADDIGSGGPELRVTVGTNSYTEAKALCELLREAIQ